MRAAVRVRRPQRRRSRGDGLVALLFLTPWLVGMVVLTIGPMAIALYLSFTDYGLLQTPRWIGLNNYSSLVTNDLSFLDSVKNTILYVVITVPGKVGLGLGVALLLNARFRGRSIYRSAVYIPSLLGASVALAVTWRQIFTDNGLLNQLLRLFGVKGPDWISDPRYALYVLVLLAIWQFGTPMLIFLAGLQHIPSALLEAAMIDGASPARRFFSVTLPLLTPLVFFNLVMQVIGSFQVFSQAYVVSGGTGGPANSTLLYSLYLYNQGFVSFRMGYAAAMAWMLLVVIAAITATNFLLSRYWVFYDDAIG